MDAPTPVFDQSMDFKKRTWSVSGRPSSQVRTRADETVGPSLISMSLGSTRDTTAAPEDNDTMWQTSRYGLVNLLQRSVAGKGSRATANDYDRFLDVTIPNGALSGHPRRSNLRE